MSRKVLYAILLGAAACAARPPIPCIAPPCVGSYKYQTDEKSALDVSAKLQKIALDAGVKLQDEFKTVLEENFDKMSDSNVALYLFLNAIDCYLKSGKVGQDVAKMMAGTVHTRWGSSKGFAGITPSLTPAERALIAPSPFANQILGAFTSLGIE
jgi:hypothetical protein